MADGCVSNRVIHFHPVFSAVGGQGGAMVGGRNIVCGTFDDVFGFVAERVVHDMREWAQIEDANDLVL